MQKFDWEEVINSFDNTKVLVIGDAMIDSYIWGDIERNSPEAPIPIISAKKYEKKLGGAANVALNIKSLGGNPILCTVIGNNDNGFFNLMNREKLTTKAILQEERKTTIKTRIISNNTHQLRVDEEETSEIECEKEFINLAISLLDEIDVVVFQDYNKGVLTKNVIHTITETANSKNKLILVDPKEKNYFEYCNTTLFKPNLKELELSSKQKFETIKIKKISEIIDRQMKILKPKIMMITLSENGIFFKNKDEEFLSPVFERKIIDVSGAGDCIIAILSLVINSNLDTQKIVKIANLCGGLACEKVGVAKIDKQELIKEANRLI